MKDSDLDSLVGEEIVITPEQEAMVGVPMDPEPEPEKEKPAEEPKETPQEEPKKEPAPTEKAPALTEILLSQEEKSKPETQVPVHVVADLRERLRQANAQIEELKQTRPAGGHADVAEVPIFEGLEDDDLVSVAEAKKVLPSLVRTEAGRIVQRELSSRDQKQALSQACLQIETAARGRHPDYDSVVRMGLSFGGGLSPQDKQSIVNADDPAEAMYQLCNAKVQEVRSVLGVQMPTPTTPTPEEKKQPEPNPQEMTQEEILKSDDDFFDECFPKVAQAS